MTSDGSCPNLNAMHGHDVHVVALDGDKLKPREDQRKGGNGFGINEDGAGYTLTGVDRHGVAYAADGGDVAATITRQISEQSGQDNRANAVVECFENYAQDSRVQVPIDTAPTQGSSNANSAGVSGNNPLVVMRNTPFVKTSHAKGRNGDGEKWEQCELAGTRNAIEGGDGRNQECIVSTNSNGGDVAATLTQDLAKQTGAQQANGGGGYVVTRNLSASGATCSTPERTPPSPPTSASASSLPSPQEPRRAQSAQG